MDEQVLVLEKQNNQMKNKISLNRLPGSSVSRKNNFVWYIRHGDVRVSFTIPNLTSNSPSTANVTIPFSIKTIKYILNKSILSSTY